MTAFAKIIATSGGFLWAEPMGGMAGVLLGHACDWAWNKLKERRHFSLWGRLAGVLARLDGEVNPTEMQLYRRLLEAYPPSLGKTAWRSFEKALKSHGFITATEIKSLSKAYREQKLKFLSGLFMLALADGEINAKEKAFLDKIANMIRISAEDYDEIRQTYVSPDSADPYLVLGIKRNASPQVIKAAWRKLALANHPDIVANRGGKPGEISLAARQMAQINAALSQIKRERAFRF